MNKLTLDIKIKGYSLDAFLLMHNISLRTYRRWEKKCHKNHDVLIAYIDAMESK